MQPISLAGGRSDTHTRHPPANCVQTKADILASGSALVPRHVRCSRVTASDLAQFRLVVAHQEVDSALGRVLDQGELLAHAAQNDVLRGNAVALHQHHLVLEQKHRGAGDENKPNRRCIQSRATTRAVNWTKKNLI